MSPVKYELGFDIPEDDILHNQSHENLKSFQVPQKSIRHVRRLVKSPVN
jgi:hypothetical protein